MAKDVNIHIKTPGASEAKQNLDRLAQSGQNVGQQVDKGQQQAAESTKKASKELSGMDRILSSLKTQVTGFVAGWLGLAGVQKLITWLIEKLERISRLQSDIYQKSIELGSVGQALEFQTGTRGQQKEWTQRALQLQQAGALTSPQVAQQMMISADIAFAGQGGIKSPQIMNLLKQISPFIGSAGLGPDEIAKVFEFAGTAGVSPTAPAYKQYLSQLQAGFTASKATSFGQFMTGLQKGGTAYMSMGGSLTEAISAFSGARSVMPNEALAATLLEQLSRLSSGAYAKPLAAIEGSLGVKWGEISTDKRLDALLRYVRGLPEGSRAEILAEQGFPIELTTQVGKMVSPEATKTMSATRAVVASASPAAADAIASSYMQSDLAKQKIIESEQTIRQIQAGPQFANWNRRIQQTKGAFEISVAKGEDGWILDRLEPYVIALEGIRNEIDNLPQTPASMELRAKVQQTIGNMSSMTAPFYPRGLAERMGYRYTQQLNTLQQAPVVNDYSTNYYPTTDRRDINQPRVGRDTP